MIKSRFLLTVCFLITLLSQLQAQPGFPVLSQEEALEDLNEFARLLETESSYVWLSVHDWRGEIEILRASLKQKEQIGVLKLSKALADIMYQIGDRHCKVEFEEFEEDSILQFEQYFPMTLWSYQGQIVALERDRPNRRYQYYLPNLPYLKQINGEPVMNFVGKHAPRAQKAPDEARLSRASEALRNFGETCFLAGIEGLDSVTLTFTNLTQDSSLSLPLNPKRQWYVGYEHLYFKYSRDMRAGNFDSLHRMLEEQIMYLALPDMVSFEDTPEFESFLKEKLAAGLDAKAWIFDVRQNGGGTREIMNLIAPYVIPASHSPWVANVAMIRSDQQLNEDIESMGWKYLYAYDSQQFSEADREAIDRFEKNFSPRRPYPEKRFSAPFYGLLKAGPTSFKGEVYILTDQGSFSAASIFAAVFKGLPNVTLAGVRTDGSSGRSQNFYLPHSQIRVKLSTMISYQRDGLTLDGNGTVPDLPIPPDEDQLMRKRDSQLEQLIDHINRHKN